MGRGTILRIATLNPPFFLMPVGLVGFAIAKPTLRLLFIPDINGDKSEEVKISYANGDEQILYLMPFPEVAADIQAISAVQTAGYAVSQELQGNYQLVQGDTQLLMTVSSIKQVNDDTPPGGK